tara:strand:+ start:405 stop:578 length:174 start_codon:yes stop_codon:yes gene_type:complete
MELNKIILEVLNKHIKQRGGRLNRKRLADELEKEVDKYCMTLMEAVACGTLPNNEYE